MFCRFRHDAPSTFTDSGDEVEGEAEADVDLGECPSIERSDSFAELADDTPADAWTHDDQETL